MSIIQPKILHISTYKDQYPNRVIIYKLFLLETNAPSRLFFFELSIICYVNYQAVALKGPKLRRNNFKTTIAKLSLKNEHLHGNLSN